jgi:RNA polymerase sigma-70 factor (ECF subfamily)
VEQTSLTLLSDLGQNRPDAWRRLDGVYRPFLTRWFRSRGVRGPDAADLTQDVLIVLMRDIHHFQHSGRTGAFRTWLRKVCLNRLLNYLRSRRTRGTPIGGTDFNVRLGSLVDAGSADGFDRQHDEAVLSRLLTELDEEFEPTTMRAFRRVTLDAAPAAAVATELQLTVGAVYIAKSRVLRRLREMAAAYVDGALLN